MVALPKVAHVIKQERRDLGRSKWSRENVVHAEPEGPTGLQCKKVTGKTFCPCYLDYMNIYINTCYCPLPSIISLRLDM